MEWIELLIGGSIGFATSVGLILIILRVSRRYELLSRAEAHHTHTTPIPRLGGIALAGALVAVVLVFSFILGPAFLLKDQRFVMIAATLTMFGLGLCDDFFNLGAKRKLFGQVVIACITYFCGIGIFHFKIPFTFEVIDLGLWSLPVTVFWLVAMTNLINLIDGVDGLAGGICLMLMALFVYVSVNTGILPIITIGMVGALLGFLKFNFPPARIYMGDGGAYMLGFFIGCNTIVTSQKGTIVAALMAPLFVLALPILDTSLALVRRGLKGLPLFRPDRKHIHHRLLAMGHSRRKVVLGLYCFTGFFLLLGFATFAWHGQYFPLLLGIGTLAVICVAGKISFSREWFSVGRAMGKSIEVRADIQYAMCLTRWLALEGRRAQNLEELAEDTVFVARKLGFTSVWICLQDEDKRWQLTNISEHSCYTHRHPLAGHKGCFLELGVARPDSTRLPASGVSIKTNTISDILSDLMAEGWAKAIADWKNRHQLPVRFDARPKMSATAGVSISTMMPPAAEPPPIVS